MEKIREKVSPRRKNYYTVKKKKIYKNILLVGSYYTAHTPYTAISIFSALATAAMHKMRGGEFVVEKTEDLHFSSII